MFCLLTGEKPYKCHFPGCSKVFDQSSNLNKHFLTHIGQKPYQCSDCGEKFSQTSNLAKHMRKHTRFRNALFHNHHANNLPERVNNGENSSVGENESPSPSQRSHGHQLTSTSSTYPTTSGCYPDNNIIECDNSSNQHQNGQPISLTSNNSLTQSLRLNAIGAAATAFLSNRHSKLTLESLDSKLMTGT